MKVIVKWVQTKHSLNSRILFFLLLKITRVKYRSEFKNDLFTEKLEIWHENYLKETNFVNK